VTPSGPATHLTRGIVRGLYGLPAPVLAALAGRPPDVCAGLDPEAWLMAKLAARVVRPIDEIELAQARELFDLRAAAFAWRPPLPVRQTDRFLPGPGGEIPARLYEPDGAPHPGPLLVYFHGGGFVQGGIETHDASCRLLCHHAGVRVLSVEYRLAPEDPFPAAVDDALAAYAHVAGAAETFGADPTRLALGGDSAGGNLAAVTAHAVRDDADLPDAAFQLLLYPVTDVAHDYESERTFAEGFFLTKHNMDWYRDRYVPEPALRGDPRVSPLLADTFAGLPPAYVAVSLADPLRDEGEAYAQRLAEAGVPVAVQRHPLLHGFFNTSATRGGRAALGVVAGALRQGLATTAGARVSG
jgi:acetyl esterase